MWPSWIYARVEYRFGGSIWSDRAVGRTLAEDFEGMGSVAAPIMAVLRPKKAWRSLGDLAESPSTDAHDLRTAYGWYGSADSANIL